MAKTSPAPVKPLTSRGYGKIVFLTLIAILIGCALMGYEVFVESSGQIPKSAGKSKVPSNLPPADKSAPPPAPVPGQ